ncbi:MAG: helix-turn-helix domain-containing protein [Vicinamibacteria bacterium]
MELSFLRLPPSPDLAAHVENFWFMCGAGVGAMPEGHRILPDGCMEFVFQLGNAFEERGTDGHWRIQAHLLLVGQMARRVDIRPTGIIHTVGVHFRPAGVNAFVDGDLSRFANSIRPLESEIDQDFSALTRQLKGSRSPQRKVAILESFLRRLLRASDPQMAKAANDLAGGSGAVDLAGLADAFHLSGRQFRRRFEFAVGLPPKRFSRLVRFQRVFEQQREGDARAWSEVALDCGYYDQAHFNRDFKAFAGVRPKDIMRDADPLTSFFLSVSSKTGRSRNR